MAVATQFGLSVALAGGAGAYIAVMLLTFTGPIDPPDLARPV